MFVQISSADVIPNWGECQEATVFVRYRQPPQDAYEVLLRDAIRRVVLYLLNQTPAGGQVSFYDCRDCDITAPLQADDHFDGYDDRDHQEF